MSVVASPAAVEPSLFQSFTLPQLPSEQIRTAVGRAQNPALVENLAMDAMARAHNDGLVEDHWAGCGPDDLDPAWWIFSDEAERAVTDAGHEVTAELRDLIFRQAQHLDDLRNSAARAGTDFGCREEEEDARSLEAFTAPDTFYVEPLNPSSKHSTAIRFFASHHCRGRARRPSCNAPTRGSRRAATSSRAGPGDDDPGGESEPALAPVRRLDLALAGEPLLVSLIGGRR